MRAVYLNSPFQAGIAIELAGKEAHHLLNVIRVKTGDKIMLLNGRGLRGLAVVESCSKREIKLTCESTERITKSKTNFSLGIGKLKKEAMDDVLKSSCELGISSIYIMKTERSQKYEINKERALKLLIAGIEQSNNAFIPEVTEVSLADMPWEKFDEVALFHVFESNETKYKPQPRDKSNLILIGPEGGFSESEISSLPVRIKSNAISFELPILRAPTAFNCALGYLQAYC